MKKTKTKKETLLVVDDVPTNLKVLLAYLHHLKFKVLIAEDGEDALEKVAYAKPGLILLDVMMPRMDGFETCRRLKANENTRNIPVIFMTALNDTVDKITGFQLGAVDYITKPFQQEEVLARITAHLKLRSLQQNLERKNLELEDQNKELLHIQQELKLSGKVIESTLEGVLITDANLHIVCVNHSFENITGYTIDEVRGKNPRILASGQHDGNFFQQMWKSIQEYGHWRGEIWNRRKNGEIYPELLNISEMKDEAGQLTHYVGIFSDISSQQKTRDRIHRLAYYDMLTELPNRLLFTDRLKQALARAIRHKGKLGILLLDVDRFKLINDTLGHSIGDILLKQIAKRLQGGIREMDTVARIGGDEFAIILPELNPKFDLKSVANKILAMFTNSFHSDGKQYYLNVSIGLSCFPEHGEDAETLLRNADGAMFRAKEMGRNNYQVYRQEINYLISERLQMETALRHALEHREFRIFYQPQVDLSSGKVVAVEALVRWNNPGLGIVMPDRFIPLAEETGLIVPIGYWVLQETCMQIAAFHKAGLGNLKVAVNLSPHQFLQPGLLDRTSEILTETGMDPNRFELEITESAAMPNLEYSISTLQSLRNKGITVSVDDFGTGFSSLGHLKRLPINKLKIDQSFVRDVPDIPDDTAIVSAIIVMAHSLNLQVVAEGVENHTQLDFLKSRHCDFMQGYLVSKPVPIEELPRIINYKL
ncbi:MAG: EAL domain-containing protein [Gammaproteobacteria bacterium]|nr:EAL domain-containing protein [Gammaproteobacteria bacterium]